MCDNTMQDDLVGKILVVNPEVLRCEYRVDTHQIYKATGGNGASVNARGNAVFCRNIFTGRDTRFQRYDFIGELKKEYYPDWLKQRNEHDRQNNSQTPGRDIHKSEKGVER